MALYEDLKLVGTDIERAVMRATDLETLVRLNSGLISHVQRYAFRNAQLLERICDKLGIDYSDIPRPMLRAKEPTDSKLVVLPH